MRCRAMVVLLVLGGSLLTGGPLGRAGASAPPSSVVHLSGDVFVRHTVQEGETLFAVARSYRTSVTALARLNGLEDISRLTMGQTLLVPLPAASGDHASLATTPQAPSELPPAFPATHMVREGETLFAVARLYHLSVDRLLELNALPNPQRLAPGQVLRLVPPAPEPSRGPGPSAAPKKTLGTPSPGPETLSVPSAPGKAPFVWPLRGAVLRRFGQEGSPSLLLEAPEGTPVCAAAAGKVLAAGWMKGFGNAVYLQHADGIATFYGNCGIFYCKKGAVVRPGERLATVGKAPGKNPSHLAFTVLKNGKAVDPLTFLPKK